MEKEAKRMLLNDETCTIKKSPTDKFDYENAVDGCGEGEGTMDNVTIRESARAAGSFWFQAFQLLRTRWTFEGGVIQV